MKVYTKDKIKHPPLFVIIPNKEVASPLPLTVDWKIVELGDGRTALASRSYSAFMRMKAFIGKDKMTAITGVTLG